MSFTTLLRAVSVEWSSVSWLKKFQEIITTVFARCCLNMFCKTWLIVSKLYTQANKTQHWEINHSHLCQIETLLSKLTSLSHMNTLSDQQQHTSLLYIKHCSLLFSLFLFSSTEATFSQQPKNEILNSKSLHYSSVFYSTVNSVKAKIKQK